MEYIGAREMKTNGKTKLFRLIAGVAMDPNYHGAGDTMDHLEFEAFELLAKATAMIMAMPAIGFESLRPKGVETSKMVGRGRIGKGRVERGEGVVSIL